MVEVKSVLDNLLVFHLVIGLSQGRKKLKAEDIGISEPDSALISLGSKKVFDPDRLLPFRMIRNKAFRLCREYGIRFMDSPTLFAVEVGTKAETLAAELKLLEAEFEAEKKILVPQVDQIVADWRKQHATHQQALKESFSSDYFDNTLSFAFQCARIGTSDNPALDGPLVQNVTSLGEVLIREVSEDAAETYKTSFLGKNRCSHRVLAPLRRISDKLKSFGFLTPSASSLAVFVDQTVAAMPPKGGYIEGTDFLRLSFLMKTLGDKQQISNYLTGTLQQPDFEESADASSEAEDDNNTSDAVPLVVEAVQPVSKASPVAAWF
ncbi:MAG: DUF3150 domain-containing protein [Betaproteobacteria bacterium]|jgi:hypothetical protein|nr:DUF3150 domain-containing protein [Betaproteobacteria bacterium]